MIIDVLILNILLVANCSKRIKKVYKINQGRACDLGRGLQVKSKIRSPHSTHTLKILQCNINGLTSPATRIKLDQLLEIALKQDVKVIAVQETKLKESTSLKVKGFNIFRVYRKSKSGGGLAFFVRDINYQKIEYPTDWSDLEVQGIRIQWRGKPLDIINVYHPPNHKPLPPALSNLLNKNSIIVGDLNAKHPSWGCSCSNARGEELLQLLDDTESMILNDGTHTFTSYSYNTSAALDIAITSSELFPQCSWRVLDTIGNSRTTNSKLWRIVKKINKEQEQCEESNSVIDTNGQVFPDDKAAANGLAVYYQETSKLVFTSEDKSVMKRAKNIIHGCRTSDVVFQLNGKERSLSPSRKLVKTTGLLRTLTHCPNKYYLQNNGKNDINQNSVLLDSKNLIPGEQYGYRRGHSTVDQIISFCQSIRDAQNCKPTHHTMAALLDLTKAFDRVWKHKLLIKLHDTFNIRGNTLAWISDFPHHRSMRVNFNNTFSDPVVLGQGVPQGSVLSPTLFSLYLAGIEKIPSVEMRVGLFADDIVICGQRLGSRCCNIERHLFGSHWPILEYGFPVYCCASAASLEKLEKIQLGAARIITGLRRSCPKEIVLFEADLQPLHLRSKNILTNYFNKLSSYGHHNKTSLYFNNWHNNQRLKRNSPFSYADHLQLPSSHIEPHSLKSCLSPSEGLPRVHFHFNMSAPVTKQDLIPAHLRQLALESINEIPCDAIKIYTDGSRLDDRAGSGIYIENSGENFYFCHRNPDFSSVFKSELMAIKLGLEAIINESDYGELWILSDSRSSLQHLHNWTQVGDKTSISILHNLKLISKHHDVHFQWIPSHVDIFGNEQTDRLAREGCSLLTTSSPAITYSEHQSKVNRQLSKEWKIPPSHHWYAAQGTGLFSDLNCDRASKTAISRLASGHTKSLSFFEGRKTFKFCSKCKVQQASAEHILGCLGLSREDLYDSPLLVIDFLRVNNLMDLV
ncbi:probable RNA-directed DNA polymerase from transposon BS [Trichonephila clavipes]|uniref:Probable RNA-directed DNA polymerase from transposon BS n=1 Tax=Trichonephila clavipes TaxID=2585209 RepID=A0A8X7BE25_TRICX|nr:probable RNA-directed DNA polymerase from transposon BS [Trichonephila clavipes]